GADALDPVAPRRRAHGDGVVGVDVGGVGPDAVGAEVHGLLVEHAARLEAGQRAEPVHEHDGVARGAQRRLRERRLLHHPPGDGLRAACEAFEHGRAVPHAASPMTRPATKGTRTLSLTGMGRASTTVAARAPRPSWSGVSGAWPGAATAASGSAVSSPVAKNAAEPSSDLAAAPPNG